MWDALFNWGDLASRGADAVVYFVMAMVGTSLFLIRLAFAMFGGDGGDFDVDVDADMDVGTDASFTLFSLLSVMAFIMGTGWMGLACRFDWGLSRGPSAALAVGFGAVMMLLASGLMYATKKLNMRIDYDASTAVGRTGRVYMTIPANGHGRGKVQVSVSGRLKTMPAASKWRRASAHFADIKVVDVHATMDTLIVEPLE